MQINRQCLGVLSAVFLICAILALPNTTKLALAIGVMSTDYTGQKAALINIKTVASSSESLLLRTMLYYYYIEQGSFMYFNK
jgi:hypothetical protein